MEFHRSINLCLFNACIISVSHHAWLFLHRVWYQTLVLMLKQCFSLPKMFVPELSLIPKITLHTLVMCDRPRSDWQTQQTTAYMTYVLLVGVPRSTSSTNGHVSFFVTLLNMIPPVWICTLLQYLKPITKFSACLWAECTHISCGCKDRERVKRALRMSHRFRIKIKYTSVGGNDQQCSKAAEKNSCVWILYMIQKPYLNEMFVEKMESLTGSADEIDSQ